MMQMTLVCETHFNGYILGERKRKFSFFFTCFLISSTLLTSGQQVSKDITSEQCEYRTLLKGGIQLTSENEHLVKKKIRFIQTKIKG